MEPNEATMRLERQLREAPTEELLALLEAHGAELTPRQACQALANPFASREVLERIAGWGRLMRAYEVRRALARHAAASEAFALQLMPGLFWRDLAELSLDVQLRPPLRAAAERLLGERLAGLAEGEKMSLARRVGPGALARLLLDPSRRVIAATLENPRLTEGMLFALVRRETAQPAVLALVAESPKWGRRYELRVALAQNPATPIEVALRLLPTLKRADLKAVAHAPRAAAPVRQRARLLAGESSPSH